MGQEVKRSHYNQQDFLQFEKNLKRETDFLDRCFAQGKIAEQGQVAGFEIEACLVDNAGFPMGNSQAFLKRINDPLVVNELATFNVELNADPVQLQGNGLQKMHESLSDNWQRCQRVAAELDTHLVMIGILPTITPDYLCLDYMSPLKRYRALNEQLLRLRKGKPLAINIQGKEQLNMTHNDVMFEAITTSFQVHIQVSLANALKFYNLAKILSAPIVALTANSPYLFGKALWHETRIPVFEQTIWVPGEERVTFGHRYVKQSLMECYRHNINHYAILLPMHNASEIEALSHVQLFNGTIWRWNRPLIGFDADKNIQLRIEHRVIPSGPTVVDSIANAALFYGALHEMAESQVDLISQIPHEVAKANFYAAAKNGLEAELIWRGKKMSVVALLQQVILPAVKEGLKRCDINLEDQKQYVDILEQRLKNRQNGARWQISYINKRRCVMQEMLMRYIELQEIGHPVHQWRV